MTQSENQYSLDPHVAECYDNFETETDDIELIRNLASGLGNLRILEPFCGTGRILIPLVCDGHEGVGLDSSPTMLDRARMKAAALPAEARRRIELLQVDVTASKWPRGFDLVILGGNCFYELSSPEEQARCIESAASSLVLGGHVYVDNNHMEGDLDESWRNPAVRPTIFPSGTCADGARLEGTTETIWFDASRRLVRCRRTVTMTLPDGTAKSWAYVHQKHPPSTAEVEGLLTVHGFTIERTFGDRAGSPYTPASARAIFWARKTGPR